MVSIASGKQGVGKSVVASNLGARIASAGQRVVLLDLDGEGAGLARLLGVVGLEGALAESWGERGRSVCELVHPIAPGLDLIPGGGLCDTDAFSPFDAKRRLLAELRTLDADLVIADVGCGSRPHALDFLLASDVQLLVTIPQLDAVLDAYSLVKRWTVRARGCRVGSRAPRRLGFVKLGEALSALGPDFTGNTAAPTAATGPWLVTNRVSPEVDLRLASLCRATREGLGVRLEELGSVPEDPLIDHAIRSSLPVVRAYPRSPATHALSRIAARLLMQLASGSGAVPAAEEVFA